MSKQVEIASILPRESAAVSAWDLFVQLDRITHRFGSRTVFEGVTEAAQEGEILVVSGANGSGKSTLLRIIAGLLTPTSGRAIVSAAGTELNGAQRRRLIGYVAPDLVLYRELTGAENLQFFAELHGVRADRAMLVDLLTRVGLRGRGRDAVGGYSSGMRQRLKYAFALLHDPPILLLDEPTANLDTNGVAIVEEIVKAQQMRPGGGLTIVATNEPRELEWSARRVHLGPGA
ncbi:MAG TPA: heme ABC exporter ATP-binding protein CcmA [Chthonomonadaceae bacterium]|nr:heme ABC exporter ATP-binding protein CcmA [Chthonomonadaceae bacterium]